MNPYKAIEKELVQPKQVLANLQAKKDEEVKRQLVAAVENELSRYPEILVDSIELFEKKAFQEDHCQVL